MALTKQTIIEKISEKNNCTPSETKNTIEHLLEIMKTTPATGEEMILNERRVVTFKVAGGLKDKMNG